MTSRERIIAVLKGNEPDRIPWIPLCSWSLSEFYSWSMLEYKEASNGSEALKRRIDFYKNKMGADYMQWVAPSYYRTKTSPKVEVKSHRKGNTIYTEYHTPVGSLKESEGPA